MKITVETVVKAPLNTVWDTWNNPEDIKQWNTAQEDWHTPRSTVDLREGGKFSARMEAKDGSMGFDFEGTYTRVEPNKLIEYRMDDDRQVTIEFVEQTARSRPREGDVRRGDGEHTRAAASGLAGNSGQLRSVR